MNLHLERRIVARVPYFLGAIRIVATSDLVVTLPARLAQAATLPGLALRRPPLDVKGFDVLVLWHERFAGDPARIWFRELIRGCAARG